MFYYIKCFLTRALPYKPMENNEKDEYKNILTLNGNRLINAGLTLR